MSLDTSKRKKDKGKKTKQKLLDTASELFANNDFDAVSVDRIVEAAGIAKGTFYIYFDTKDALIATLISEYVNNVDADYKAHLDSLPFETSASDKLLSLVAKIADVLEGTIGYHRMRMVYRIQLTGVLDTDSVKRYNRKLYRLFADLLYSGVNQGAFTSNLPVEATTKHFVMAMRGISFEWCIRSPDYNLKEQAVSHFKLLLNGICDANK